MSRPATTRQAPASPESLAALTPAPVRNPLPGRLTQKKPAFLAVAVALAAVGGLLFWYGSGVSGRESILVVDMPVSRGETITQDKLATIEVSAGTGHVVAADDVGQIIGRIALVDLTPGALVNHSNTGETLGVASGQAVVGIGLKSTNMPSRTLVAGDTVRIVYAPIDQTDTTSQRDITAIIEQTHFDDIAGLDIVDVRLDKDDAATAARWSAGGSAALVLDGGGR